MKTSITKTMMCRFGVLYNGFNDSMQRRTWGGRISETYLILTLCYLFYEDFMYIYVYFVYLFIMQYTYITFYCYCSTI